MARQIAENLHCCDLSEGTARDQHIRRYAELIEARAAIVPQTAEQITKPRGDGRCLNVPLNRSMKRQPQSKWRRAECRSID